MLPKVLQGMNAFIDGDEFIGLATKVEPSVPKPKTKGVTSPGTAGEVDVLTSKWEKSEPKITLRDYPHKVIAMVGNRDSLDKPLTMIGAMGADDDRVVEIEVTGIWKSVEATEWAENADAETAFTVNARTYQLKIDGKETLFIDYERNIVRLDGNVITKKLNQSLRRGN